MANKMSTTRAADSTDSAAWVKSGPTAHQSLLLLLLLMLMLLLLMMMPMLLLMMITYCHVHFAKKPPPLAELSMVLNHANRSSQNCTFYFLAKMDGNRAARPRAKGQQRTPFSVGVTKRPLGPGNSCDSDSGVVRPTFLPLVFAFNGCQPLQLHTKRGVQGLQAQTVSQRAKLTEFY